jgi:5-bromo-4-chloroindolyl phosphate hydrolysis protein
VRPVKVGFRRKTNRFPRSFYPKISGLFGIIILISSSTPLGLYLGLFFLIISFVVLIIGVMWKIAGKLDEIVVKITESDSSYQIESEVTDSGKDIKENKQMSNSKVLVIGITLAVILYLVTSVI